MKHWQTQKIYLHNSKTKRSVTPLLYRISSRAIGYPLISVEAKTAEQFASGEVAHLLQQGNTEQVWGQMSNTEGSLPMLSDNELYKVATVAETGNYSVANIGDTTNDGIVDVNDYQALINTILANDHEQIEAASYDDIVRYDLDVDGFLDW